MAIQKIFAYNTGSLISGTTQVGDIAISEANVEYSDNYGGLQWWGGPDETYGYVIAHTDPSGSHDGGAGGSAYLGFWRSSGLTDSDFLTLCNSIPPRIGDTPFTNTTDASSWLYSNGYWTSFYSVTPTPTASPVSTTPTPTPTVTQTPTATDLTNITTYTISGCTSLNEFVANLGPGALAPGDIFYFEFTGGTPSGCYRIVNKINAVPTDGTTPLYFYTSCALCVAAREVTPTPTVTNTQTPTPSTTSTPTPSVTNTQTPSVTPTLTPTPSTSPIPVTGYSFNLVALPYNFPSSGNTIMNGAGGATSGTTDPNVLATGSRGIYWNSIDSDGINRTNYFSGFTGQSITITMSQTGSTAIYSGDTNSLKTWTSAPNNGFVFGAGIGVPPVGTPSGTAVLIQSASTQWTLGLPVYISAVIN
jgi:hypothetical protein